MLRFQVNTERRCATHDDYARQLADEPIAVYFHRTGVCDGITACRLPGGWRPGGNGPPSPRKRGTQGPSSSRKSSPGKRFAREFREYFVESVSPKSPHFDPF